MAIWPVPPSRAGGDVRRGARVDGLAWLAALAALAIVTAGMFPLRESLGAAHVALAYLLLVLGASARGGRALGLAVAIGAFGCFTFFFVPPYGTFAVAARLDWLVLGAFLATSAVAAHLLARAQAEAAEARRRAAEVDRLSALGAEALNAGRAVEALGAVAEVIRTTLGVTRAEVYLRDAAQESVALVAASGVPPQVRLGGAGASATGGRQGNGSSVRVSPAGRAPGKPDDDRLVAWVAEHGRPAAERPDGTLRFGEATTLTDGGAPEDVARQAEFDPSGARTVLLPLRVRDRTVGVLGLRHADALILDPPARRFLEALAYYAALGAERVRLEADAEHAQALREADRLKDALLASVSHDLRTPLTTIKALAHRIGAEGDARAVTIEEEADRLNRFVADLLDLSRLAGGALQVAPEITAAEDLIGAALQRVGGTQGTRPVVASLDPSEVLLLGRFDFVHTLRVLVNLIENALKYSPADAPVDVGARRAGEWLEFVVADRGPGVPPAEQERIFAPFYRPAGSPPDVGGAGLGLSIARRLAEAQGGSLRYEPRDGGGSRFVLRVPAADLRELEAESGAPAAPAATSL